MAPLETGTFTPVSHALAQEVGLVCAAVYGVVWRYCQMKEGVCRATLDKMGKEIKLNRATMLRNIKTLCDLGYLIDQTPDLRNVPHTYALGKAIAVRSSLEADSVQDDKTVVIRNSLNGSTVAQNNATVAYNNSFIETVAQNNATVAESYLKKDSKRVFKENQEEEKEAPAPIRHSDFKRVCNEYQQEIGGLSQSVSDCLNDDLREYPADWMIEAMRRAALANNRRYSYVRGILSKWKVDGGPQNDQPKSKRNGANQNGHHQSKRPTQQPAGDSPPAGIDASTWQRLKATSPG